MSQFNRHLAYARTGFAVAVSCFAIGAYESVNNSNNRRECSSLLSKTAVETCNKSIENDADGSGIGLIGGLALAAGGFFGIRGMSTQTEIQEVRERLELEQTMQSGGES